jgi:hypothetical protein
MRPTQYDVVVIGAGAAGLAAAVELARAGCSTLIMEARERIGGRCWSLSVPGVPVPVELGAEFIHGRPPATLSLIRDGASARVDAPRKPWAVKARRLEPRGDYFSEIQAAMNADRTLDRRDMSFDAYLERALQHRVSQEACVYARMLVQGYDAADPARASARAIVAEWTQAGATALSRPLTGYGPLLEQLYDKAAAGPVETRLHTVVRSVQWRRGFVDLAAESQGRTFHTTAARALITLPAGVLQAKAHSAGAVVFEPTLSGTRGAAPARGRARHESSAAFSFGVLGNHGSGALSRRHVFSLCRRCLPHVLERVAGARAAAHGVGRRAARRAYGGRNRR